MKVCAYCFEEVEDGLLECPKCHKSRFAATPVKSKYSNLKLVIEPLSLLFPKVPVIEVEFEKGLMGLELVQDIGVETKDGIMTSIIPKDSWLPLTKNETFTTAVDNQTKIPIHLLFGENPMAKDCQSLCRIHLMNIRKAPRGIPQIQLGFDLDKDGNINFTAIDLANGALFKPASIEWPSVFDFPDELHPKEVEGSFPSSMKDFIYSRAVDRAIYFCRIAARTKEEVFSCFDRIFPPFEKEIAGDKILAVYSSVPSSSEPHHIVFWFFSLKICERLFHLIESISGAEMQTLHKMDNPMLLELIRDQVVNEKDCIRLTQPSEG